MANTKRNGDTADASQMTIKADTVMAPNTLSRTVFEVGSDWSTVTFFFPAAIATIVHVLLMMRKMLEARKIIKILDLASQTGPDLSKKIID